MKIRRAFAGADENDFIEKRLPDRAERFFIALR
jgi:hypothetical protein